MGRPGWGALLLATDALAPAELLAIRDLLQHAFRGDFTDADWSHALGGHHALVFDGDEIVAHAAVVPRVLRAGGRSLRTGYVEAVGTRAGSRRRGAGSAAMRLVNDVIFEAFELGALSTGRRSFFAALGWHPWGGPTYAETPAGVVRTADEDDGVMVLRTPRTPALPAGADLVCDWRPGELW